MENLIRDLRYATRMLLRQPGFVIVVVFSLILGIGFNVTIFSLTNTILLRPLPVIEHPESLVELYTSWPGLRFGAVSYPDYLDYRDRNTVFSDLVAQRITPVSLSNGGRNEVLVGDIVSGNYFSALGVKVRIGRSFTAEDDRFPNANPVVVISHALWQSRFGADPHIVGRTIILNSRNFNIIGVAPATFIGAVIGYAPDVWAPMMMQSQIVPGEDRLQNRDLNWLNVIGRLKPGVSLGQAQTGMQVVTNQLAHDFPVTKKGISPTVTPIGYGSTGIRKDLAPVLILLMALVLMVLLIACFNIASLLLARGMARRKEIGVRIALGAARGRLIRQLLTESLLLSALAGVGGLALAHWTARLLLLFIPSTSLPLTIDTSLDYRTLYFTAGLCLLTAIIFGLIPALQTTRSEVLSALKDDSAGQSHSRSRLRAALIVAQVVVSVVLLISAGLFIRSLQKAQSADPGFRTQNLLIADLNIGLQGYDKNRGQRYYHQLIDRLGALPGIQSATMANAIPLAAGTQQRDVSIDGFEAPPDANLSIDYNIVAPKYFETLSIPLLKGRDFTEQDNEGTPGVIIINEAMAKRFWPNQNPLGRRLRVEGREGSFEVIGVVRNARYYNLKEEPLPYMYLPLYQSYASRMALIAKSSGDAALFTTRLRSEIGALDGNIPFNLIAMSEALDAALVLQRFAAALLGIFGILALLLAAIGIYGVMAYFVNQRTKEIGLRMALGAQQSHVFKLVLKQGLSLTGIGLATGLIISFILTRFFSTLLYGIGAADPVTFFYISALLVGLAFGASYFPARRATRIDPMLALRSQ
jgi:predicted permease